MKNTNWKDFAELIGIAAIVASLIFVGLQMKQAHEIALAEIYQARTAIVVEEALAVASNPYLLNAYVKAYNDRVDEIDPIEQYAAENLVWADLMLFENSHYLYDLGYLTEEHWTRAKSNLATAMQNPFSRQLITTAKSGMRESFQEVIEDIESQPGAGSSQ